MNNKIILIDSNSLIYRAFYALPPLSNSKGLITNAIFGYLSMLVNLIENEHPTHLCAIFDMKGPTFRNELYADYKRTRKPMPDELAEQIPLLKDLLCSLGINVIGISGYEADDIIGTLSKKFKQEVAIVSGDRDMLQLVDESTKVFLTKRGVSEIIKYDLITLKLEGFTPEKIIEYKALAGDQSDNIPGAPGVGEKTALKLLEKYGTVEMLINNADEIKGKLGENIRKSFEIIKLSKELATININVPIEINLEEIKFDCCINENFLNLLNELEIKSLVPRYMKLWTDFKGSASESLVSRAAASKESSSYRISKFSTDQCEQSLDQKHVSQFFPRDYFSPREIKVEKRKIIIEEITNIVKLNEILGKDNFDKISLHFDEDICFSFEQDKVYIVKCKVDLFEYSFSYDEALSCFKKIFSDTNIVKISYDIKRIKHKLISYGIELLPPYEDIQLKEYLLRSHISNKSLKVFMGEKIDDFLYPVLFLILNDLQNFELNLLDLIRLYKDIELPLIEVLYDMEIAGFLVDSNILQDLSNRYCSEIETLSQKIFNIAKKEFNLNSPKQLSIVLFKDMGLNPAGKNKTGGYSVDAEVLESIDHPISELLLRYRKLQKLQSTYVDGMRNVVDKRTGRVHTSFQQCVTATGRLSSIEPNLQNIPVRNDEGREIRKMLIASTGNLLVTADYSQIELRLLASFSEDKTLVQSYKRNEDIHVSTAAKIYGVSLVDVTPVMRSAAKAINFGIIYGISPFGLSKTIGASVKIAKDFVDRYFESHPGVKNYMNENSTFAFQNHYIRSLSGRIRFFPEFETGNIHQRNFSLRAAMNMPLQGSSSDIIKIAMLKVHEKLKKGHYRAKLILQVHDELILDVPENEVSQVKDILIDCMESAVELKVPLIVDTKIGRDWFLAS